MEDASEIFGGLVDSYEPHGPFGAKEIGEGPPVRGAVAHAVSTRRPMVRRTPPCRKRRSV